MENIEWLEPWAEIQTDRRKPFEAQLKREVQPGHLLYQVEVNAVAQRFDCDDVLFALVNHVHALAVVHLTYSTSQASSQWPRTQFFDNIQDWVENCMKPDNQDYQ